MKAAMILAGCGHLDGAEINESVLALLELDRQNIEVDIFAPDMEQVTTMNHITQANTQEKRNVLVEASRIARGKIQELNNLNSQNYDMLVLPGGFGVAANFSNISSEGANAKIFPQIKSIIESFFDARKPIGAICIAPALLGLTLQDKAKVKLTLGEHNPILEETGIPQETCTPSEIIIDEKYKIVSTPAFMMEDRLSNVQQGIAKLIRKLPEMVGK